MGGFFLLVELHREGSAPAACAAGLFILIQLLEENLKHSVKPKELLKFSENLS